MAPVAPRRHRREPRAPRPRTTSLGLCAHVFLPAFFLCYLRCVISYSVGDSSKAFRQTPQGQARYLFSRCQSSLFQWIQTIFEVLCLLGPALFLQNQLPTAGYYGSRW